MTMRTEYNLLGKLRDGHHSNVWMLSMELWRGLAKSLEAERKG